MIVVCGVLADAMTELMCARLEDLGFEYTFLDEAQVPGRYGVTWRLTETGVEGRITTPDRVVDLEEITGVYIRYVTYRGGPERPELSGREKAMVDAEYQLALMHMVDLLPCTVVNRAKASTSNDSKIFQASVARSFGFSTPRTLVTTEPEQVRAFYAACDGRVVYKSLSSVRSIVHRLTDEDLGERLDRVRSCPTQFQEWIEGVDVRVHTVGERVFATEIASDADDYRYAHGQGSSLELQETTIPAHIAEACVAMARSLGLELAGIDLRRTKDGFCCFEVNPSPGFIFYERGTGQPISEAVAHLLRGAPSAF
jgi:glutathione synthase/RimK-type ligase-like ATP-grasp enzyme